VGVIDGSFTAGATGFGPAGFFFLKKLFEKKFSPKSLFT